MIQQYKGPLGKFQYDDTEFIEKSGNLHYIGTETDGSRIKIPKGIINCTFMFEGCNIVTPPTIPKGVTLCFGMFRNCKSLIKAPDIPEKTTNCCTMFYGCDSLITGTPLPRRMPRRILNCFYMYQGCSALKNYCLDDAIYRKDIYRSCSPVVQEIDGFIQNFKERSQLNGQKVL